MLSDIQPFLLSVKWKYKIHITLTFICDYSNDLHETNIV